MRLIDADELDKKIANTIDEPGDGSSYSVGYADALCYMQDVIADMPTVPAYGQWVSVEDGMPPEHDSIFKKHKGTSKWLAGMYETISDDVNVVLRFEDGTEKVYTSHTTDGVWRKLPIIGRPTVTHWMPLPEPPEKRYKCRYADYNGVCDKLSGNGEIIYCVEGPCPYDMPEEI